MPNDESKKDDERRESTRQHSGSAPSSGEPLLTIYVYTASTHHPWVAEAGKTLRKAKISFHGEITIELE